MNAFSPKRPQKPKTAVREQPKSPDGLDLIPFVLAAAAFAVVISLGASPATSVGDEVNFAGPMPATAPPPVAATVVQDLWGDGAKPCSLDLPSMVRTGGTTRVAAVSREQVVLQWVAPRNLPIGCPGAPALLAVSADDYQQLVGWRQKPARPVMR